MSRNFDLLSQMEAEFGRGNVIPKIVPKETRSLGAIEDGPLDRQLMRLVQVVFFANSADAPRVVVFSGVERENQSSRICLATARILARCSNQPVCIVDGDVRDRRISQSFDLMRPATRTDGVSANYKQSAENLWAASINTLDPANEGVLAPPGIVKKAFSDLRNAFEFVIVDAPGATANSDAASLGKFADGAILIVEANSTRKAAALQSKKAFDAMNVRILGVVLNNRTYPIPERLYRAI